MPACSTPDPTFEAVHEMSLRATRLTRRNPIVLMLRIGESWHAEFVAAPQVPGNHPESRPRRVGPAASRRALFRQPGFDRHAMQGRLNMPGQGRPCVDDGVEFGVIRG